MATPKVKLQLQLSQLRDILGLPEDVDIVGAYILNDPLSIVLILCSEDSFTELYLPDGGFDPNLSYKAISREFFTEPA